MHQMTSLEEIERVTSFVKRAAKTFESNPKYATYTDSGKIEGGELFAVRWGLDDTCIMVFRIDETFTPTIYQGAVKRREQP